ncbi:hypothetical protein D3C85_1684600 [compost metagenome]
MAKQVDQQPTAIKPALYRHAAPAIGHADQLVCALDQTIEVGFQFVPHSVLTSDMGHGETGLGKK